MSSYHPEEVMPQFGKILSQRHGFRCTVLFTIDPKSGKILQTLNAPVHNIPGLEALKSADLMIVGGGDALGLRHGKHLKHGKEVPLTNLHLTALRALWMPVERFSDSTGTVSVHLTLLPDIRGQWEQPEGRQCTSVDETDAATMVPSTPTSTGSATCAGEARDERWQLPQGIVNGVIFHHNPLDTDNPHAVVVYLGNVVTHKVVDES
jgi:hypothetical protein